MGELTILHCFADQGIESEALSGWGTVVRVGIDPSDTNESLPIKADARKLPFSEETHFDVGLFHPPCQAWAAQTHIHGERESHENLIPLARDIAEAYCDEWIIENVPGAPLNDPVRLNGGMFGSPLHYERAFETSYHVPQPRNQSKLCGGHPTFDDHHDGGTWVGGVQLWKTVKGYSGNYDAKSMKREAIPRSYIDYLMRYLLSNTSVGEKAMGRTKAPVA